MKVPIQNTKAPSIGTINYLTNLNNISRVNSSLAIETPSFQTSTANLLTNSMGREGSCQMETTCGFYFLDGGWDLFNCSKAI